MALTNIHDKTFDLDSSEVVGVLDEVPFWSAPFGIKLLEAVKLKQGIKALDIGFGTGFPLTELAMRLGNSSKIYGIDPWKAAIERARQKFEVYGIKNIETIAGVAERLPFKDQYLDLIISNNGINNVNDLNKVIDECARTLKTGGQFVQSINLDTTMVEFYQLLEEVIIENKMEDLLPAINQHIYEKRKPLDEFLALLESKGFAVEQVIEDSFSYRFVDGKALFNHYFIRLAFMPSWNLLLPESKAEHIFKQVENKFNTMAKSKGFVELSVPFVVIDCRLK